MSFVLMSSPPAVIGRSYFDRNTQHTQIKVIACVCPSLQTRHVVTELAKFMSVSCEQCVIDTDVRGDQMKLSDWQHIVVGTPQCIEEKLDRKLLNPNNTKLVVLDEVDEMFKRGFKDSIINVIKLLPHNIQVSLFSSYCTGAVALACRGMSTCTLIIRKQHSVRPILGETGGKFSKVW